MGYLKSLILITIFSHNLLESRKGEKPDCH
jgi:hypothetical protein